MRVPVVALIACAVACTAAPGLSHGGQYRGPQPPPGIPGIPGAPPGPPTGGPGTPGPNTGGRAGASDETSWQVWWEFNKDPFLLRLPRAKPAAVTGSDEFYLGLRREVPAVDLLRATVRDKQQRIVPALAATLQRERNRDLATACLVALAKVGLDAPGVELDGAFAELVPRDDQEVRETAVLAFGIARRASALPLLAGLLRDSADGRRLLGKSAVNDRTRAFAAWSLGMLGTGGDAATRRQVHDLLVPLLQGEQDRDLMVAAVSGLGLLGDGGSHGSDKRLAWQTVDELWTFYRRDLGKADQIAQAHVPAAIARLLGRGGSSAHQRSKRVLAGELTGRTRRHNSIYQSAALALGQLCQPAMDGDEDAGFTAALLQAYRGATDQQTRFFALIALGRIGGPQNRSALLVLHDDANANTGRPWVALALGLIADASRRGGVVDETIARVLLEDLCDTGNTDARAAFAVALGLTGYTPAVPEVLALLKDHEKEEVLAGYLCTSLALLGDEAAIPPLTELLQRSVRRPFLLQQAAVALGRLGDERTVPILTEMLGKHDSTAALSAIANALALIGDRRSIDPLIAMVQDDEVTKLARAFAAAALGGVGDKDELPWNAPLCRDVNYRANVDTLTNGKSGVLDIL